MKYLSQYNSLFFLTHPVHAAVTPDEFPNTATVRRKVDDFERQFVAVFVDAFQCLAPLNQLAAVSVATRPDRANQAVSLLQYLASPADGPARRHATRPSRCSSTSSPTPFPSICSRPRTALRGQRTGSTFSPSTQQGASRLEELLVIVIRQLYQFTIRQETKHSYGILFINLRVLKSFAVSFIILLSMSPFFFR